MIGIAGGSGSGKTWLARALLGHFKKEACLVSLDDFYRDRSHLPAKTRARINFDHPRSVDWSALEFVLQNCANGKKTVVPNYDFATHSRSPDGTQLLPKPLIVVEGLWLFRRPNLRRLFNYKVYIDCDPGLRLERRIKRDCIERGRTEETVREQFGKFVEPMHQRFISSQQRWADLIFTGAPTAQEIGQLVKRIESNISDRSL